MVFQFTPYALLTLFSGLVAALLAVLIWQRRPGQGVVPFVLLMSALVWWSLSNVGELLTATELAKNIFVNLAYIGITLVPAFWLAFTLEYTGRGDLLTKRNVLLLAIHPAIVNILTWTNPLHYFFWTARNVMMDGDITYVDSVYGTGFWLHAGYSYLLILAGTILMLQSLIKSPGLYRGQIATILIGIFAPWISNAVYLSGNSPLPPWVDITPFAFAVMGAAMGWSMYRFRLMDIVPVARDKVFEGMSDVVMVLDSKYRLVDVNSAALKILEMPEDKVIGQPITDVIELNKHLLKQYWDVEETQAEIDVKVDDGRTLTFEMQISALRNRSGELTGRIVMLHDITALKQTNRELQAAREAAEESNRLKSEFLATMSHELRTPLNAITGFTEVLIEGIAGELNDMQRKNLSRIKSNSSDLLTLINDLLDISRIEAGHTVIELNRFSLKDWVTGVISQVKPAADAKKLSVGVTVDKKLPDRMVGDEARLKQVAVNLLSNAIKFTDSGEVRLDITKPRDNEWQFAVKDTGIGIPDAAKKIIFDRFRQVDSSATRRYGGSGLGLAIVKELTEMMGGSVRVESEVDKGSTFTVTLPILDPAVLDKAEPAKTEIKP